MAEKLVFALQVLLRVTVCSMVLHAVAPAG